MEIWATVPILSERAESISKHVFAVGIQRISIPAGKHTFKFSKRGNEGASIKNKGFERHVTRQGTIEIGARVRGNRRNTRINDVVGCASRAQLRPAASVARGCAARDCASRACATSNDQRPLRWRQSWRLKTHAHAATAAAAAAAAGRCLHASTSPPPPPPPPIPRLVGKYPHTPCSNQSALACPRGCSHGPGGILSLFPSLSLRPLVLLFLSFSVSLFPPLSFTVYLSVSLSLFHSPDTLNASSALYSTGVIPVASRGTGRGHLSRGWG